MISIVVPTYNVEKYLERCIRSCINQDVNKNEYEIIIVNDGSTDNSLLIAEKLAKDNSNVRVVNQDNIGLSGARNRGLSEAKGEYVWFVDSDDWIVENCLSLIVSHCEGVDALCLSYTKSFEDGTPNYTVTPPIIDDKKGTSLFVTRKFCTPAQFYVYRREFLIENSLKFYEGIFHEDMEFTPRMLCLASNIRILKTPVYFYFIRGNSITTTVNPKKSFDLLKVALSLSEFSSSIKDNEVNSTFNYYISICVNNAFALTKNYSEDIIHDFSIAFKSNRVLVKHLRKSPLLKNVLEGYAFSIFPGKSVSIYKLIQQLH